jgi:hypothetical protein
MVAQRDIARGALLGWWTAAAAMAWSCGVPFGKDVATRVVERRAADWLGSKLPRP